MNNLKDFKFIENPEVGGEATRFLFKGFIFYVMQMDGLDMMASELGFTNKEDSVCIVMDIIQKGAHTFRYRLVVTKEFVREAVESYKRQFFVNALFARKKELATLNN